jgi:hypothetical protein
MDKQQEHAILKMQRRCTCRMDIKLGQTTWKISMNKQHRNAAKENWTSSMDMKH